MPTPVLGKPFNVDTLVTSPSFVPVPTGSIQLDFGDGTPIVTVPLDYRTATAQHTYNDVGAAQITATYSGDSNFAPASASLKGQIVRSLPDVTLNVFGDSISYAWSLPAPEGGWPNIVGWVEGWGVNDLAWPGYRVADDCRLMYGTTVSPVTHSAVFLGENDSPSGTPAITQYQSSMLACVGWLLIPDSSATGTHPKVIAQDASVIKSGSWTQSTLYSTMGLETSEDGASLTTTIVGSTAYLGLSATSASDYTIDVFVDGAMAGEYTPTIVYSANTTQTIPWGIRIPISGGSLETVHTVAAVCKTPGASGCFVDWIAGNGFVSPNHVPLVWLAEPYRTNQQQTTVEGTLPYIEKLRQLGQDFQADGLGVTLVDLYDSFNGQYEWQCLIDQLIHPSLCGHQVLAATFTGQMDWLFTKDQRIDFGVQPSASYSSTPIPINVIATSGLPVNLSVLAGPASAAGNSIAPNAVGTVILQADQAGDANYLPAASESATIKITPAPVTVSVEPSATRVIAPGVISAAARVTWSGSSAVPGSISLRDGDTVIGSSLLDATGTAKFSGVQLSVGSHVLNATYAQQGNFAAGVSAPVNVEVIFPPADIQLTPSASGVSLAAGQQVSFTLNVVPSLGFIPTVTFSCEGLPALASCQFSQNPLTMGKETVTILTTGPNINLPAVVAGSSNTTPMHNSFEFAGLWWSPGLVMGVVFLRRRCFYGRTRYRSLISAQFFVLLISMLCLMSCGSPNTPKTPVGTSTVTITAVAVQGTHSVTRTTSFALNVTR